jgi:hypothetical protein
LGAVRAAEDLLVVGAAIAAVVVDWVIGTIFL